jgi:predicted MFS family arabinose efflux permease
VEPTGDGQPRSETHERAAWAGIALSAGHVRRREAILLLTLAAVQFTSIVDFMVVMPLGPVLIEKLGINGLQYGFVVASYVTSAGIAAIVASTIMDRFGRKVAFLGLYSGFLVGTLCCGLARNYPALLAARVVTGAFGGILSGLALTIVADVFPEERRGRATGVLMSAFAVASSVGVPIGIALGTRLGWNVPFLVLAGLGSLCLFAALRVMPPLRDHLHHSAFAHPLHQLRETFSRANNLRAFGLTVLVMFGGFSVIPYISVSLVRNVGVLTESLWLVYATGGILSFIGAPLIGRLADQFGKLRVYRAVASISACLMLAVTNLPHVPPAVAVAVVGTLMLSNAGRMVAALSMITSSVESRFRGGFMSANSAVQHLGSGLGAVLGGLIVVVPPEGGVVRNFYIVGLISMSATLASLWLAGLVRPAVGRPAEPAERGGAPVPAEFAKGKDRSVTHEAL